ncbi:hypothetical protein FCM35_KLT06375 [Carex littledalei]|uniref:CCHC-type domain-containing protein n=1 Tax=Carex littledalei TaxID=544730 RepID=A0A833R0K0_9POAL|nr:hypothetical protein FCM35_KLT06375 [Carex littledalei]
MEKGKAILENNPTKLRVRIDTNTTVSPPNQQEWQVVRRKRRYPDHWRPGGLALLQADQLPRTQPYVPFQTKPTYAQILANPSPAVHPTSSTTHSTTPPTSPPTSPHSPTYYLSPHSPTPLRFPPSAKFSEWKGRCFRCCRTGHSIATCRNPPKCGRYWKSGHTGSRCRSENTKQVTLSAGSSGELRWVQGTELGFDELLAEPKPLNPPPMPEGRPQMLTCFVDRDPQFYHEMNRLHNAVVVHTAGLAVNFDLSVDKVAEWVAESKILPATDVTIAALTKKRFLIMLPPGLAPEVLIQAIPYELWEEGLSFQKWDPLEDAATIRPEFKTMVELSGIPPHMYREKAVINAVSTFGTYLGTVAQPSPANISSWTAVVATESFVDISCSVMMVAGPIKYPVQVCPVKWKKGPMFREEDFPQPQQKFSKPPKPVKQKMAPQV